MALKIDLPTETGSKPAPKQKCGLVMPISSMPGYSEAHWTDVRSIISDSVDDAGLEANLVSVTDEVTVIQKTIVQNLYDNSIVIVDVSGKNPNVMFELGLRLAFDKPTIIVKDDETAFVFDTGTIEHLVYPKDLRFGKIVEFKAKLSAKVRATIEAASKDPKYSTFLKHFGKFTIAKLDEKEVSGEEFILEELKLIRQSVDSLSLRSRSANDANQRTITVFIQEAGRRSTEDLTKFFFTAVPGIIKVAASPMSRGRVRVDITLSPDAPTEAESIIMNLSRTFPDPVSAMEAIVTETER